MQRTIDRFHFLDSMRATLMMLGIVLHSAQIFNPNQSWLIYSEHTHPVMTHIVDLIHLFRMPAFFIVSGFFCFLTLNKYDVKKFFLVRVKRIVIPFICTALILNSLQTILLVESGWFQFDARRYLLNGGYISHLWFLTNLMFYFTVTAILFAVTGKILRPIAKRLTSWLSFIPAILIVLIMPAFAIPILALNKIGFPLYTSFYGLFDTYSLLIHAPYFVFGIVLAMNKPLLYHFSRTSPFLSSAMAIVAIYFANRVADSEQVSMTIMAVYFEFLSTWCLCSLCFYTFNKFMDKPSSAWNFLSDASYTIYLFHHVFVVAIGLVLIHLQFSAIPGFLLLVASVSVITILIHASIVSKNGVTRYMFNGK